MRSLYGGIRVRSIRSASTTFLPDTRCCMCPGRGAIPNPAVALGLPHDSLATRRGSVIV